MCPGTRSRRSERFSLVVSRAVLRRYESIHKADSFADVGGGCVADMTAGECVSAPDSASPAGDDDGGDPDPEPDSGSDHPPALSAAEFSRQSAAFRTSKTGTPGVTFCTKAGAFKASFVAADGKPTKLGSFESVDDAVTAISRAYAAVEVA